MNQENEQPQNDKQYVLLDAGGYHYLAIPMDSFIEMNGDIKAVKKDGYGDDITYELLDRPMDFKLMTHEQMLSLQVKKRLTTEKV